ncbi:MAG: undecaprenyldiphospho-muramoylpentapeptide beta-N-acetylglucosaminyltransferase [Alphaproteobacteria bacterium]
MAKLIALATGGTGGHVFPAEALAAELMRRGYRLALVTDRRGDAFGGTLDKIDRHTISAAAVSGRGIGGRIDAAIKLFLGFLQARKLLNRLQPRAIVGFGGYPSVPTMLAAGRMRGIISVIHEQNAVLGRANRLLAPRMDRIATSFETVAELRDQDRAKTVWTGNPVRTEIAALAGKPYPAPSEDGPFSLLIVGGSQGARVFGEVVPKAIALLPQSLREKLTIVQQARAEQVESVQETYARAGFNAEVAAFFKDIPERLEKAHLVICRAGASTMAELTTVGRPAILVPYQHAIDDHQTANAACLSDAAGGWMIPEQDLTAESLSTRLTELLSRPRTLSAAAQASARIGMPEATTRLADLVTGLVDGNGAGGDRDSSSRRAAA